MTSRINQPLTIQGMRHIASFSIGNLVVVCGTVSVISQPPSSQFISSNLNVVISVITSSEATNVLDSTIASLLVTVVDDSSSMSEEYDSELEDSSSDSCQGKDEEEGTGEN